MTDPDAHDHIKRAQAALETAETNLEGIVKDLNRQSITGIPFEIALAHAEARIRLGQAWADLASRRIAAGPPLHTFHDVTGPHPGEG